MVVEVVVRKDGRKTGVGGMFGGGGGGGGGLGVGVGVETAALSVLVTIHASYRHTRT